MLYSGGSVCLANLGGLCLHSGGSWRPGVSSLPWLHYPDLILISILQNGISFQKQDFQVIYLTIRSLVGSQRCPLSLCLKKKLNTSGLTQQRQRTILSEYHRSRWITTMSSPICSNDGFNGCSCESGPGVHCAIP